MKKTESGIHEIKNKRRPRAVVNKKEGLHLQAKKRMSRTSKIIVTLCSVLLLSLAVYGVGSAFFKRAQRNNVDLNYGSPSVPVAEGEVYSLTGGYAPVDVFARLNWKFSRQSLWYAEMHGTVDTIIQQSIATYKQYEKGILISADLTESSLIKSASQFCYLKEKDRVIWRKSASKNYDGLNTEWQTGAPYNIMTIGGEHGFKAVNGMPAYELSVYVIAEDTVANASPVTATEDGKFKITYDLKPETWQEEVDGVLTTKGAAAYYINQMIFTGGLTAPPEFKDISVTFTFDENWQVFQTDIEEKYSAKYGPIAAPCASTTTTKYEYNTEKAHSDAYEEYFCQYAEGEVNNAPIEKEITALDCLSEGFGSVLTEPTVLNLDLKIDDTSYRGIVDLDLSKADFTAFDLSALTAKVKLGALSLWVEQGNAYLDYGGLKLSLRTDELIALIKDLISEQDNGQTEEEDLLSALADGEFTLADGEAELHSVLPLFGLNIPVDFYFTVGENHEIAVEKVTANISIGDSLAIDVQLGFGEEHLPALSASEKAGFVPLMPYVNELIELFSADILHADFSYKREGIAVSGGLDLRLNELALAGEIQVDVSLNGIELSKKVRLSYTDDMLYLDLDGIKVQATVEEGIALLGRYVTLPDIGAMGALSGFDFGTLINILLSDDFAAVFSSSEGNGLLLAVKGSELLSVFGVDFALGDVTIAVGDKILSATALGAEIKLTAGTGVALDALGYTSILPYVQTLIEIFSNENLAVSFSYTAGDFTAAGEIMLNLASKAAAGEIVLGYGNAQKTISVIYKENFVYLNVEGLQIKANIGEAVELISSLTGAENDLDAKTLINKVLSLDFGSVIALAEENDTLAVLIAGTELLHTLGIEFDLKTVTLRIESECVQAEALGAVITVKAGNPFTAETAGYIDIVQYADTIGTMIESGYISADVHYASGKLTITGAIALGRNPLKASAQFELKYEDTLKQIGIVYAGDILYLTVYVADSEENLKVSLEANKAIALVTSLMGASGDTEAETLIERLLCLNLNKLIPVFEEAQSGDVLKLTVAGNELLNALGVEFELGNVQVEITKAGAIIVKAAGAEVTAKSGAEFSVNTYGYLDLTPMLENITTILTDKALALCGDVVFTLNDFEIDVEIENAVLSFENGIKFHLHTFIYLQNEVRLEVFLSYENGTVKFACGALGAKIVISEIGSLKEAFLNVYGDLYTIVGNMLVDNSKNPLPAPDDFKEMLGRTSGDGESSASIWTEMVNALTFATTERDVSVRYGDLLARLFFPSAFGFLGVELSGSVGDPSLRLDGMIHLKNAIYCGTDETGKNIVQFPEMPKIDYLGTEEFKAIIGYLGSAVDLLNATDLTLTFDGTVISTDEAYQQYEGVKHYIKASMSTHRGKSDLIHLDVDGKNIWVDTDVFAHASINITATNAADNSLYIDFFILDGAPEKDAEGNITYAKDNMLDFYVTLSQFGPIGTTADTVAGYNPVRLYAPSNEILTLLSSALPMLGIDVDILNNYMIEKWLSLENVAQLKAFGDAVSPLLSGLLGAKQTSAKPAEPAEPLLIKDYLKGLTVTAEGLSIEFNSEKLYGIKGLQNVTAILAKEADTQDEDGGYHYGNFLTLDLYNIYNRAGTENTSLTGAIDYNVVTLSVPSGTYQSFLGVEKLLLAIAKSATHGVNEVGEQTDTIISGEEEAHHYKLNNNFYIDGTIEANLLGIVNVTIDLVAISVNIDENSELGINLRLKYNGKAALLVAINGDSTVDITIKGGMVYMKRVQTTRQTAVSNRPIDPITIYRAMPLQNFTGDLLGQLGFILNFGDLINNAIKDGTAGGGDEGSMKPSEKADFGTTLQSVLKVYTFTEEGNTEKWRLEINGSSFSNDILGDVVVEMTATDSLFKEFNVTQLKINIPAGSIKLGLTASLNLTWHNAGGISDDIEEQIDRTLYDSLSDKMHGFGGMIEKLNAENGWTEAAENGSVKYKFLEGKDAIVSYKYQTYTGETVDFNSQQVIVSTGNDGFAENTLFSILDYPDLSAYPDNAEFYTAWDTVDVGGTLGDNLTVYARQQKQLYLVTFRSDEDLGNEWNYDETENMYFIERDMEYGAIVVIGGEKQIVTDQNTTFVIKKENVPPFEGGLRAGNWQKDPEITLKSATFIPEYEPDIIVYVSKIAFTAAGQTVEKKSIEGFDGDVYTYSVEYGTTYALETAPVADGYTFLGWYAKQDGVWSKVGETLELASEVSTVTVEALWAKQM